jgi:hypothetical protein
MRKPNQGLNQLVQIFLVLSLVTLDGISNNISISQSY